jgi:hypothetical protein
MVKKGYWIVLPYREVRHLKNLRVSPFGIAPQRDRRPRTIVDYTHSGVNPEAVHRAPNEAMQFGGTLERIFYVVYTAHSRHGPVYLGKFDISDGFYRVALCAEDIPTLGVVFPTEPGAEPLIAFPGVLPMGWTESPPYFCALTETIVDLANQQIADHWDPPAHHLETAASAPPPPPEDGRATLIVPAPVHTPHSGPKSPLRLRPRVQRPPHQGRPVGYADVFVDDEILVGQGTPARLNKLRRILLHVNDLVFRPNDDGDSAVRREPMSLSKLAKGDGCWSTYKQVLGWIIDTIAGTVELPPHRKERLLEILSTVRGRHRIGLKDCYRLLGELRSMVLAIPGGKGLFSQLQLALKRTDKHRVRLHQEARDQIEDFWELAQDLTTRPTRLAEIVPGAPSYVGACDAAKPGLGGVWLPPEVPSPSTPDHPPLVWRWSLPKPFQDQMVSDRNRSGNLTNSDIELAGTLAQQAILTDNFDCRERNIAIYCDNTPAVSWRRKGSVTTPGPASYLLREASLHQRRHRYQCRTHYVPGPANKLADIASRRFDLSDTALLTLLDSIAPQNRAWEMRHLSPATISKLTSALLRKRPGNTSLGNEDEQPIKSGQNAGSHLWPSSASPIPSSPRSPTRSGSSESLPPASATAASAEVVSRSELITYATKYTRSRRRSWNWGPRTPDTLRPASWTHASVTFSPRTPRRTQHRSV